MRLIDAHQIERILTYTEFDRDKKAPWLENEVKAYKHFLNIIQESPTAYDVDKVVEKLKRNSIPFMGNPDDRDVDLNGAIKIVKAGGVSE